MIYRVSHGGENTQKLKHSREIKTASGISDPKREENINKSLKDILRQNQWKALRDPLKGESSAYQLPPVSTSCVFPGNSASYLCKQTLIKDCRLSSVLFFDFQSCFNFLINTKIILLKISASFHVRQSLFSCSSAWGGVILALEEHLLAPYWHRNKLFSM